MKISEAGKEKCVIGIQATVVVGYIWFTLRQDIKQRKKKMKKGKRK